MTKRLFRRMVSKEWKAWYFPNFARSRLRGAVRAAEKEELRRELKKREGQG